jgi:hypothetical protein
MDLIDIYRVFHPATAQYIFLSSPWNFLQNGSHKANLNKYKNQNTKQNNPLYPNRPYEIKLEISSKENQKNFQTHGD